MEMLNGENVQSKISFQKLNIEELSLEITILQLGKCLKLQTYVVYTLLFYSKTEKIFAILFKKEKKCKMTIFLILHMKILQIAKILNIMKKLINR